MATVCRSIHDREVEIEVFYDRPYGYRGTWLCSSVPYATGASSTHSDTIEEAISLNEMNAAVGMAFRLEEATNQKKAE